MQLRSGDSRSMDDVLTVAASAQSEVTVRGKSYRGSRFISLGSRLLETRFPSLGSVSKTESFGSSRIRESKVSSRFVCGRQVRKFHCYNNLQSLFEYTFYLPATSAPPPLERAFSQGGLFMRPHCARLGDRTCYINTPRTPSCLNERRSAV
jgi:hypothetical protein